MSFPDPQSYAILSITTVTPYVTILNITTVTPNVTILNITTVTPYVQGAAMC